VIPTLAPPVPLLQPPGSVEELGAVVDRLTTAGWSAGSAVQLLAPAVVLSGWQGADASTATAEVGTALGIAADLLDALTAARQRLADHHESWLAVRARTTQLSDDQRAQFAAAGSRLAVLVGTAVEAGVPAAPPGAQELVDSVAADDAARAAEHRALLAALADDAVETAAVLTSAALHFGVSGLPGDAAAVTLRLAVQLPGWGAGALVDLGRQAAGELTRAGSGEDLASAVVRWRPFVGSPGFADALVGRLGAGGVTWLLSVLAEVAGTEEQAPLAGLLAVALSGSGGLPGGDVGAVLDAVRLDPADPDRGVDRIGAAMGLVLAAGASPTLAAVWGRQLLAREAVQGAATSDRNRTADPVAAALTAVARAGDPAAAALLLDDPQAWRTLLDRPWPGGADALDAVVGLAIAAPDSGRAARAALLALGEGLGPGSTARVLDDQGALAEVREAMAALVASCPEIVVPVLDAAATGAELGRDADTALRGLGHLVADAAAAHAVTVAVQAALREGAAGAFAGEVAGVHVAVLEYGQRLQYAQTWARAQGRALDRQALWQVAVHPWVMAVESRAGEFVGEVVDAVEGVVADMVGMNGDVEIGPDTGEVRSGEDADSFAVATLGTSPVAGALAAPGPAAQVGFDRAGATLGDLTPPPADSLLDHLDDLPLPGGSRGPGHR